MKIIYRLLFGFLTVATWNLTIAAESYPTHAIRMVIGYSPGGPTDVIGRIVAQGMSEKLGQSVVVENKPGANGLMAARTVQREHPDGYTILFSPISYTINPLISPKLAKYDPRTSMDPVALVASLPLVMITAANSPYSNAKDIIAAAQSKPEGVTYGTSGNGSSPHLAGAMLQAASGAAFTSVPFRGNAPAMAEVMADRVEFMFYPMTGISAFVQQNKLKVLAVGTAKEHPEFPGVPTVTDATGVSGIEHAAPWVGLLAPKGTPKNVVDRLNQAVQDSLADSKLRDQLKNLGAEIMTGSPADFGQFLNEDIERWNRVIKAAGITADN